MRPPFYLSSGSLSRGCLTLLSTILISTRIVHASIPLDLASQQSIKDAAKEAAQGMLKYYTGYKPGDVPGNLPDPYYWWEAGAMFGALIDYWYYTGDDQWNDITMQAMMHQVGADNNYMPDNQSTTLGNDDQAFWGIAALNAAEDKFPNPPEDKPQWLALAQAVFNGQTTRWDTETCDGGLRWQIFKVNKGYNYKNTISNGCFFNIGARLATYTRNETYAEWAEKAWDWMTRVGLISETFQAYDGTDANQDCKGINHIQWSYNHGVLLSGAAFMYNFTDGSEKWEQRINGLLKAGSIFFSDDPPNVMVEVACEPNDNCNVDQRSFKAYLSRFMADTAKVASFTHDRIMVKLKASAEHAALQCNGPDNACGMKWTQGADYNGSTGVGEQMAALEVIQSNLIDTVAGPANEDTGISEGDPTSGMNTGSKAKEQKPVFVTTADKAGAGIMTAVMICMIIGAAVFMIK